MIKKWLVILFLFLFVLGCKIKPEQPRESGPEQQLTTETEQPNEMKECDVTDPTDRKICELTLNKPNLQQCLTGNIMYYKFFCIALISKDAKICDYIDIEPKKNWCKAYVTRDINFCNNILDEKEKDWCYADLGMNFKDLTICDKIYDKKLKTSCTAAATNNPDLCLDGAEESKITCVISIIMSTGNKELCNLLSNEQRKECIEQVK